VSTTPAGEQAAEEMRRFIDGEIAEAGAVQVVMTREQFWRFEQGIRGGQQELYKIPVSRDDLPTYGIRYSRR
jgi:hypothetical protein